MSNTGRWFLELAWRVVYGPRVWCRTRRWSLLLPAVPALLSMAICLAAGVVLMMQSSQELAQHYLAVLSGMGMRERASEVCVAKLLQLQPGNFEVRFAAGRLAAAQGDLDRACEWIAPLAPLRGPGHPPAHLWMAQQLMHQVPDRHSPPETVRQHLLRSDVRSRQARWLFGQLGLKQFAAGQMRKSIRNLQRAVHVAPESRFVLSEAYRNLGMLRAARGELELARTEFARRAESHPQQVRNWCYRAYACELLGDWQRALSMLEQRWRATGNDTYPSAAVATCLRQFDRLWTSADAHLVLRIELLDRAASWAPGDPRVLNRLVTFIRCADAIGGAARREIRQALAAGRATATTHLLLGTDALRAEDYRRARMHLEQAARMNPHAPVILNNLAWLLMHDQPPQWPRALDLLDAALQRSPDAAEIIATRGELLARMGHWSDAVYDLERALTRGSQTPHMHRLLADAYHALGDEELEGLHRLLAEESESESGSEK